MTREQVRCFSRIRLCNRSIWNEISSDSGLLGIPCTSVQGSPPSKPVESGALEGLFRYGDVQRSRFTRIFLLLQHCASRQGTQFTYLEGQLHDASSITIHNASDRAPIVSVLYQRDVRTSANECRYSRRSRYRSERCSRPRRNRHADRCFNQWAPDNRHKPHRPISFCQRLSGQLTSSPRPRPDSNSTKLQIRRYRWARKPPQISNCVSAAHSKPSKCRPPAPICRP